MASATDAENNTAYSNTTLIINPLQVQPHIPLVVKTAAPPILQKFYSTIAH
jgi:hypothetical protein